MNYFNRIEVLCRIMPSIVRKSDEDIGGKEQSTSSQLEMNNQSTVQKDVTKEPSSKRKSNNIANFFSKRSKKMYISKSSKLRHIIAVEPTPIPIKTMDCLEPSDNAFQMYVDMDICGSKFEFPLNEDIELLDKLSDEMQKLQDTKPEPDDFFDQAIAINEILEPIEMKMQTIYRSLSDAVNTLHTSRLCMNYCKKNALYLKGKEWNRIYKAVSNLGIEDYVNEQYEIQKQNRLEKNISVSNETLGSKVVHVTDNETLDIIDLSSTVVDIANNEASGILIQDKCGTMIPIDSVLKEGKSSNRCRDRKSKKKSVRKNVMVHKGHGNKKPGMNMTKAQLSSWIEKKYSIKGKSGLNKRGHGFVLVNGGLYCNLCNKTVPDKPNQYLVGKKHLDNYE